MGKSNHDDDDDDDDDDDVVVTGVQAPVAVSSSSETTPLPDDIVNRIRAGELTPTQATAANGSTGDSNAVSDTDDDAVVDVSSVDVLSVERAARVIENGHISLDPKLAVFTVLDVVPAPDADVDDGATSSQPLPDAASLHDVEVEPQIV